MARDAAILLSLRIIGAGLWMLYTIFLARSLSQADFVSVLYVTNFSLVAILIVTLGRDVALLRFASQAWAKGDRASVKHMLRKSRIAVLGSGLLLTFGLLLLSWYGLQTPVTSTVLIALLSGAITIVGAQMGLNRDCLRAIGKLWQSQIGFNILRVLIPLAGAGVVILWGGQMSAELALLLFLLSLVLSFILEAVFLSLMHWENSATSVEMKPISLHRSGLTLWCGEIANAFIMRMAGLIGGLILAPEPLALLLAAERIANLAQFPISAASQTAAPRIAQSASGNLSQLRQILRKASLLISAGAFIGCIVAAGMAWPALWALGPDYHAALPLTLILIAANVTWALFGLAQSTLIFTGRGGSYTLITVLIAGLAALSIYCASQHWGAYGAAVSWALMIFCLHLCYALRLHFSAGLQTGLFAARHYFKM